MGLQQGQDTEPRGTPSTGPAWLLLPRVHASSSASSSSSSSSSPIRLPANIGKPEPPVTGWERIQNLFDRDETQRAPEELTNVVYQGFIGGAFSFLFGGLSAGFQAKHRYIQNSQAEIYSSRLDAVRSSHNAAIRGFLRYGWRWSWRTAVIISMFSTVNTALCVYRDVDAISHYVTAGAVTVGVYRINLGLRGLVAGGLIGAVLGVPVGVAAVSLQRLSGETLCERRRRERSELYHHKVEEWKARLQLTDELISELALSSQPEETTKDLRRIQELTQDH